MSVCPSSAGYDQPCSQSQKMSIGIFAETVVKPCVGSLREADVSITRKEKDASKMEHSMKKNTQRGVKASISSTLCKNYFQEGSARVTTGPLSASMLMKNSKHIDSHASKPAGSCLHGEQPTQTLQFANQTISGSGVDKKTEADRTSGESRKVFMYEQQISSARKQPVRFPFNDEVHMQPDDMENRCKETLRMKLREVLGNVPSDEKISGNIRTPEVETEKMTREQTLKDKDNCKARQSSDTIETDSENEGLTIKKPVTRSHSRKRDPARTWTKKLKTKTVSCDRKGHGSDVFSFAEKSALSPPCTGNRNSLIAEITDHAKKSCVAKPGDKVYPVTDLRSIQLEINGCEKAPVEELPLSGGVASPNHDCLDKNQPEASLQNLNLHHSPVVKEINELPNLVPQKKSENLEPFVGHSPVHQVHDLNCQWPNVTKVMFNSPMGSDLPTNNKKQHLQESVQLDKGVVYEAQCLFKNSTPSEKETSEFSDDPDNLEHSQTSNSTPSVEEKGAGNGLFIPVRGELDSSEEVSIDKKVYQESEDVYKSPDISYFGKSMFFQNKRRCYHGVDLNDLSPTLHAPKASENADDVCFDDIPENGLARVVSVLGMCLEKIKSKMLLVRNKKCSEILVSAAEEIHLQLRSVQSQMQSDIEKLSSLKSTKRKHLEARLQEQQGYLKVMHEKFKEEIYQYVQDCKGAMEGLETQHIELQGAIEKQKALHKKLLLQTQSAVETHLIEAHKQMMSVHKLEKQKMQKLKLTIAQCLKDIC